MMYVTKSSEVICHQDRIMMIARIQNTAKQLLLSKDCKWFNCFLLVLCPPQSNTQVIMVLERENLCWTFVRLQRRTLGEESVGFVSVSSQLFARAQTCCHICCTRLTVLIHSSGSEHYPWLLASLRWFGLELFLFLFEREGFQKKSHNKLNNLPWPPPSWFLKHCKYLSIVHSEGETNWFVCQIRKRPKRG